MYQIAVDKNVKLFVQDLKKSGGKTILFVHGWPINHKMFEYQFNVLPEYGFRCIAMDLRGFGSSDKPWEGYSYNQMADDIRVLIDTLNLNDLILAGFSMGGAIAIRYMARHAGYRVAKLALWSAAAPSFTQYPGYPFGMTKAEVNNLITKLYNNRPQALSDFGKIFFASKVTPDFMNWFQSLGLEASGVGTIKTAIALRDENLSQDLQCIRVPTGIFHGTLDRICPYDFAVLQNKGIKGSVLYGFENSGHGVFYDELARFNATFLQFLNS